MNAFNNLSVRARLVGGFLVAALAIAIVAFVGFSSNTTLKADMADLYDNALRPIEYQENARAALLTIGSDVRQALLYVDDRSKIKGDITAQIATVNTEMAKYKAALLTQAEKEELAKFELNWTKYQSLTADFSRQLDNADEQTLKQSLKSGSELYETQHALEQSLQNLLRNAEDAASAAKSQGNQGAASAGTTIATAGLLGVLLVVGLGLLISQSICAPLGAMTLMLKELGHGHLGLRLNMRRSDEIGVMAAALDRFADDLQNTVIKTMKQIAVGDLSAEIVVKDEHDEIAPALKGTIEALRGLVAETSALTSAATQGKLATRGRATKFQGGYQEIVVGINNTLDAVIAPLNVAAEYIDRISKGDIPAKVTDVYQGDFSEIKNNLNNCIDGLGGTGRDHGRFASDRGERLYQAGRGNLSRDLCGCRPGCESSPRTARSHPKRGREHRGRRRQRIGGPQEIRQAVGG